MIVKDSRGRDVAKLVDFGIAKLTLGEASSQVETRAGHVFGSPQYMSPEQWLGEQVDHRTDIYSLACVLYELLSGKLPFDGDSALSLMNQHVSRTPMQVGQVDATVRKFDPVLSKAMAKKPEDRQQSVEMLAHEFLTADIARQFSSLETLFTPFQNSNRRWQRKRVNSRNAGRNLALIVGVLLTLTLVIGLVNHQAGWICIGIIVGFAVVLFVNLRFGMPSPSKVAKLSRRNE
jgi:serine/threonine protein kinase